MTNNRRPASCYCGGAIVRIDDWYVCRSCGGAHTRSGKFLPAKSGWDIPPPPTKVIVWQNTFVLVFDPWGEQVRRYQGHIDAVIDDLADLVPIREWKFRLWPGSAPGSALPKWIVGRANEIANARRDFPADAAHLVAQEEAARGLLFLDPLDI